MRQADLSQWTNDRPLFPDARPVAPSAVRWITRTLEEAGFETWAVGGAIRDLGDQLVQLALERLMQTRLQPLLERHVVPGLLDQHRAAVPGDGIQGVPHFQQLTHARGEPLHPLAELRGRRGPAGLA